MARSAVEGETGQTTQINRRRCKRLLRPDGRSASREQAPTRDRGTLDQGRLDLRVAGALELAFIPGISGAFSVGVIDNTTKATVGVAGVLAMNGLDVLDAVCTPPPKFRLACCAKMKPGPGKVVVRAQNEY